MNRLIGKLKTYRWRRVVCVLLLSFSGLAVIGIGTVLAMNLYVRHSTDERLILGLSEPVCGTVQNGELVLNGNKELTSVDCILVLGCGVWANGNPSPMLEARLSQGVALYKTGIAPKLLMSGDHAYEDYDEVNVMKAYATEREVPSEDVFMDHAGLSTYDSIWRAKNIFGCDRVVIVSQGYHLYRAVYLAQRLGIDAYGVSADYREYARQGYYNAREALARCSAVLQGVFRPEATYAGEKIDIHGDGNITND